MTAGENFIIKCARCGARNRVPKERMGDRPVCGKCGEALSFSNRFPDGAVDVSDGVFEKEVLRFPGAVAAEFWTPRCGYCRAFDPAYRRMAKEYSGRIKFVRVNIDENALAPSRYAVKGTPTLIFFKNGVQVNRVEGVPQGRQFESILQSML